MAYSGFSGFSNSGIFGSIPECLAPGHPLGWKSGLAGQPKQSSREGTKDGGERGPHRDRIGRRRAAGGPTTAKTAAAAASPAKAQAAAVAIQKNFTRKTPILTVIKPEGNCRLAKVGQPVEQSFAPRIDAKKSPCPNRFTKMPGLKLKICNHRELCHPQATRGYFWRVTRFGRVESKLIQSCSVG